MGWAIFKHRFLQITLIVTILCGTSVLQRVNSFVPDDPIVSPHNTVVYTVETKAECKSIEDELDRLKKLLKLMQTYRKHRTRNGLISIGGKKFPKEVIDMFIIDLKIRIDKLQKELYDCNFEPPDVDPPF